MKTKRLAACYALLAAIMLAIVALDARAALWGKSEAVTAKREPTVRYKSFRYVDRDGIGTEAFRFLMPADWQFEGGIRWVLDNPGMPAVSAFRVRNPKGREEFEVFPNQAFFWTDNAMTQAQFPVGSKYFGNEVRPPMKVEEALRNIVLPRFRGKVQAIRIVSQESLPDLAKSLSRLQPQPGITTSAHAAKVRITYRKNDVAMEEEIYGVVESFSYAQQTMTGMTRNTFWMADYLFSFKAEQGKLDEQARTFQTIVHSFKVNPQWLIKYDQLVQYLAQMQIRRIQHIGEVSRIISRTHSEISDSMMKSYQERQAVNDRIADNFSQHIRGVEKYHNPIEGKDVELPSGYRHVWANPQGEYVLTDNPNYNPNVGDTRNWQMLPRK